MGRRSIVWTDNRRIVINWSASMGAMLIIAEIAAATALWKFRNYRKKSVNGVLASMQRAEKRIPIGDLYPNGSNIDKEETGVNSSEVEMDLVHVEEEPKHLSAERRMLPKKNNP